MLPFLLLLRVHFWSNCGHPFHNGPERAAVLASIDGLCTLLFVIAIFVYCLIKLVNAHGSDICDLLPPFVNMTLANESYIPLYNASRYTSSSEIVTKFNPKGWLVSVPVYLFAFEIQSGVSSLTHPVKQEKYIHWMTATVFALFYVIGNSCTLLVQSYCSGDSHLELGKHIINEINLESRHTSS